VAALTFGRPPILPSLPPPASACAVVQVAALWAGNNVLCGPAILPAQR
jgi:hypothetical protein